MRLPGHNLHRAKGSQAENTPPDERNIWQRTAVVTGDIAGPANVATGVGAIVFASGLWDIARGNTKKGLAKILVGRSFDLLDGIIAEATGTKSPLGEAADVIVDKAELMITLPLLVAKGIVPKTFAAAAGGQTVINGYYTTRAKTKGNEIHTTAEGKYSTALQWLAIGAYCLSAGIKEDNPDSRAATLAKWGGHLAAVTSVATGTMSVIGYRKDALGLQPQQISPLDPQAEAQALPPGPYSKAA